MYGGDDDPLAHAAQIDGPAPAAAEPAEMPMPFANQLTLSFQGEVYVFDSVQPERVQAVLLLLGGHELPDTNGATVPLQLNRRGVSEISKTSNSHRLEALMRYREKRKSLNFDKKVLYECRQEVACRMKRHKGQFASSKANSDDVVSASSSGDFAQSNCQEEIQLTNCQHCGKSKDSTPMMRRGPGGPRSLCNACGLMWANKKTLKGLRPVVNFGAQNSSFSPSEQSDSDIVSNGHVVVPANSHGHPSVLTSEIDTAIQY